MCFEDFIAFRLLNFMYPLGILYILIVVYFFDPMMFIATGLKSEIALLF